MTGATLTVNARQAILTGIGAPVLLLVILSMLVLPLPPLALDIAFTFNIALSLVVILTAIYSLRPLDFGSFPTVLLVATLLRLALNVASTRVVLIDGHSGSAAAGQVIEAFGAFVIGGNYAVGIVVFSILVIINFVVVTKGAGRISEVSARFTLDALPGKQMAIDADLNAGIITQDEAKDRREEVVQEADFYGSMDGAGKFVRGDAVAGILILLINILGGLSVGILQHDLSFGDAARRYTLLTIGDGLVAQIPSLVLSSAAGIMVTRVSAAHDMGQQILQQLFANPKPLAATAGLVGVMGLVPGMPNLAFLSLAGLAGAAAWWFSRSEPEPEPTLEPVAPEAATESRDLDWSDIGPVDPLGLEVGYRLIPLVDPGQGGEMMTRIKGVRRKASQDLGFLVPPVHIRDNLELPPLGYRVSVMGVAVGESEVRPDQELAINPGEIFGELAGESTVDPVFGLESIWIRGDQREEARALGYTVVDPDTVVATHLSQVINDHAHLLIGQQETQQLLERLGESHPKLVEDLVPNALSLATVTRVLQNLLREHVPIRDVRTIVECLAEHAPRSQEPDVLTSTVRVALGRFMVQHIFGMRGEVPIMTLDPNLDRLLHQSSTGDSEETMPLEPGLAERLAASLGQAVQERELAGEPAVLVVSDAIRPVIARFARQAAPRLQVLGFAELPDNRDVRVVASVGGV